MQNNLENCNSEFKSEIKNNEKIKLVLNGKTFSESEDV